MLYACASRTIHYFSPYFCQMRIKSKTNTVMSSNLWHYLIVLRHAPWFFWSYPRKTSVFSWSQETTDRQTFLQETWLRHHEKLSALITVTLINIYIRKMKLVSMLDALSGLWSSHEENVWYNRSTPSPNVDFLPTYLNDNKYYRNKMRAPST